MFVAGCFLKILIDILFFVFPLPHSKKAGASRKGYVANLKAEAFCRQHSSLNSLKRIYHRRYSRGKRKESSAFEGKNEERREKGYLPGLERRQKQAQATLEKLGRPREPGRGSQPAQDPRTQATQQQELRESRQQESWRKYSGPKLKRSSRILCSK